MALDDVLFDGFDGPDFAENGGLYYKETDEQKAGIVEFQREVTHSGGGALKLSVKPVCVNGTAETCSERAEIWERTKLRVPYTQGVWYGFAVKFAEPIPRDDHRYVIAQWKREIDPGAPGDFSPFLAIRFNQGKLFATIESNYQPPLRDNGQGNPMQCDSGETPVWPRPDTNQMRSLIATSADWTPGDGALFHACTDKIIVTDRGNKLPDPASGWIDFAVFSKPGPDGSGHIELYANGKWIVTAKGHIGHNDKPLGKNQYFKFGPYRAAHSNEWTLYYDDFRRSPRCADVLKEPTCPF